MARKTEYLKVPGVCLVDENTLRYKDKYYDIHEIQDYLSGRFEEDTPSPVTFENFKNWINSHKEEMYDALSIVDEIKHKGDKEMDIEEKLHLLPEDDLFYLINKYREDNKYELIYRNEKNFWPISPYGESGYNHDDKYYSYDGYGKLYSFNDLWDAVSEYELTEYINNSTGDFDYMLENVGVDDSVPVDDGTELGIEERRKLINSILMLNKKYKEQISLSGIDEGNVSAGTLNKFKSDRLVSLFNSCIEQLSEKHSDKADEILKSLREDENGNKVKLSKLLSGVFSHYERFKKEKERKAKKSEKVAKSPRQKEKNAVEENKSEKVAESPRQEEENAVEESTEKKSENTSEIPRQEEENTVEKTPNLKENTKKKQILEILGALKYNDEKKKQTASYLENMSTKDFVKNFFTLSEDKKSAKRKSIEEIKKFIEENLPSDENKESTESKTESKTSKEKKPSITKEQKESVIKELVKEFGEGRPNMADRLSKMDDEWFIKTFLEKNPEDGKYVLNLNKDYIDRNFPIDEKDGKESDKDNVENEKDGKESDKDNVENDEDEDEDSEGSSDNGEHALDRGDDSDDEDEDEKPSDDKENPSVSEDDDDYDEDESSYEFEQYSPDNREENEIGPGGALAVSNGKKEVGKAKNLNSENKKSEESGEDKTTEETTEGSDEDNTSESENEESDEKKSAESFAEHFDPDKVNKDAPKTDSAYVNAAKKIISRNLGISNASIKNMVKLMADKYGDFEITKSNLFRAFTHIKYQDDVTQEYTDVQNDYRDMVRIYKTKVIDLCISRYFESFDRVKEDSKTKFKNFVKSKFLRNEYSLDDLIEVCKKYERKYGVENTDFTYNDLIKYIRVLTHDPNWKTSEKGHLYEEVLKRFEKKKFTESKAKRLVNYIFRKSDIDEIEKYLDKEIVNSSSSPEENAIDAIMSLCEVVGINPKSEKTAWSELKDFLEKNYEFEQSYIRSIRRFIEGLSEGIKTMADFENAKEQFMAKLKVAKERITKQKKIFGNTEKRTSLYNTISSEFTNGNLALTRSAILYIESGITTVYENLNNEDTDYSNKFGKPLKEICKKINEEISKETVENKELLRNKIVNVLNRNKECLESLIKLLTSSERTDASYSSFVLNLITTAKRIELNSDSGKTEESEK